MSTRQVPSVTCEVYNVNHPVSNVTCQMVSMKSQTSSVQGSNVSKTIQTQFCCCLTTHMKRNNYIHTAYSAAVPVCTHYTGKVLYFRTLLIEQSTVHTYIHTYIHCCSSTRVLYYSYTTDPAEYCSTYICTSSTLLQPYQ